MADTEPTWFVVASPTPDGTLTSASIPPDTRRLRCRGINLQSLHGCPDGVVELDASHNALTSLRGCASSVTALDASHNPLETLHGCGAAVQRLRVSNSPLETLDGCGAAVQSLGCSYTWLSSLAGCGAAVRSIVCNHAMLESLDGAPPRLDRLYAACNLLPSLRGCPSVTVLDVSGNRLRHDLDAPCERHAAHADAIASPLCGVHADVRELDVSACGLFWIGGACEGLQVLRCVSNELTSLRGVPSTVRLLNASRNQLWRLERADVPAACRELFLCCQGPGTYPAGESDASIRRRFPQLDVLRLTGGHLCGRRRRQQQQRQS